MLIRLLADTNSFKNDNTENYRPLLLGFDAFIFIFGNNAETANT